MLAEVGRGTTGTHQYNTVDLSLESVEPTRYKRATSCGPFITERLSASELASVKCGVSELIGDTELSNDCASDRGSIII